jgi:branched-chain amino acid aminotransferase
MVAFRAVWFRSASIRLVDRSPSADRIVPFLLEPTNDLHAFRAVPRCASLSARAAAAAAPSAAPDIDWDALGFGLTETAFMVRATRDVDGEWSASEVEPYGDLRLSPAAAVLNYGQGIFEGMKAFRTVDGEVGVFRPDQNAKRFAEGAGRMSMPPVPEDVFVDAVKKCISANRAYIPPEGKGSLYLRPLLIGTGPILGLGPAPSYTFLVYCSPVAAYFKGGQLTPIDLVVEEAYHRAAPGGTGSTKCIGNYSPVLKVQLAAKKNGYSDVIYLDAVNNKYIEEVSSCNFFAVKGKTISTPALSGSILPGITRKSIIDLAVSKGFTVEERDVSVDEVLTADECFCTGTAVVVVPVGSVTFRGEKTVFQAGGIGPVGQSLYDELTGLQSGKIEDKMGWLENVPEGFHL